MTLNAQIIHLEIIVPSCAHTWTIIVVDPSRKPREMRRPPQIWTLTTETSVVLISNARYCQNIVTNFHRQTIWCLYSDIVMWCVELSYLALLDTLILTSQILRVGSKAGSPCPRVPRYLLQHSFDILDGGVRCDNNRY